MILIINIWYKWVYQVWFLLRCPVLSLDLFVHMMLSVASCSSLDSTKYLGLKISLIWGSTYQISRLEICWIMYTTCSFNEALPPNSWEILPLKEYSVSYPRLWLTSGNHEAMIFAIFWADHGNSFLLPEN